MNKKNQKPDYQSLTNRPIGCQYCGERVMGQIVEVYDPATKKENKLIRWNCHRCGNTVRVGRPA